LVILGNWGRSTTTQLWAARGRLDLHSQRWAAPVSTATLQQGRANGEEDKHLRYQFPTRKQIFIDNKDTLDTRVKCKEPTLQAAVSYNAHW